MPRRERLQILRQLPLVVADDWGWVIPALVLVSRGGSARTAAGVLNRGDPVDSADLEQLAKEGIEALLQAKLASAEAVYEAELQRKEQQVAELRAEIERLKAFLAPGPPRKQRRKTDDPSPIF